MYFPTGFRFRDCVIGLDYFFQKPIRRFPPIIFEEPKPCITRRPIYRHPTCETVAITAIGVAHLAAPVLTETQELFYHIMHRSYGEIELLLKELRINPELRGDALLTAIEIIDDEIIFDQILSSGKIEKARLGIAVKEMASQGNLEKLTQLLQKGPISKADRGEAVVNAATFGFTLILAELLKHEKIDESSRSQAVVKACESGNIEMVELLLSDGGITEEAHKLAMETAKDLSHWAVLRFLQELIVDE